MSTTLYWLVTLAYCLVMVAVGFATRLGRHARRDDPAGANMEFWIAQRQLPGWRLGTSLTAGWLMLGWLGFGMAQIYMYGATALWILPIPWFVLCFIVIAMVPYVRRVGAVSLPQAIEKRFGPAARTLLAVCSLGVFVAWTQAEIFMAGTLMSPFLHIAPWACMALFVAPIVIYTWLGGFRAIVTTDVIQFCLMAVFMSILAGFAVHAATVAAPGGIIAALREAAPPLSGKGQALNLWFLGTVFPLVLMIGYLPGWLIEQDLVLRIQAARSTKQAYFGACMALVMITVFVLVLPSVTAFCALVVFPPEGASPSAAVGVEAGKQAYQIIPAFIQRMPLAVSLFMLVGIVACQMSTVDTFANVTAMALAYDLIQPRLRGDAASRVHVSRVVSVFAILLGLGCALYSASLNDVYFISSGVLSACIAVPAFFIFWRRTTPAGVIAGAMAGFIGTVAGYWFEYKFLQAVDPKSAHYYTDVLPGWLQNSYGYNYVAAGVVLSFVVLLAVSLATRPQEAGSAIQVRPIDDYEVFLQEAVGSTDGHGPRMHADVHARV